jgi:hypothetical protein
MPACHPHSIARRSIVRALCWNASIDSVHSPHGIVQWETAESVPGYVYRLGLDLRENR